MIHIGKEEIRMGAKERTALVYVMKVLCLTVLDILTILCLLFPRGKLKEELFTPVLVNVLWILLL